MPFFSRQREVFIYTLPPHPIPHYNINYSFEKRHGNVYDSYTEIRNKYPLVMRDAHTGEMDHILHGHTETVRGIVRIAENGFATASHDWSFRFWKE